MKTLKYYVAMNDAASVASILGSGWSESEARADAASNGADNPPVVLCVPAELSERIERDGDTPELAALCYAEGQK
jgi:hypothetical protein